MARTLRLVLVVMMLVFVTREASAVTITETDYDVWTSSGNIGALFLPAPATSSDFITGTANDIGDLGNEVYFNALTGLFSYVHTVLPALGQDDNERFATEFAPAGFTGTAGWSFGDAFTAGGAGNDTDFAITESGSAFIRWSAFAPSSPLADLWDGLEPITFFYVSTKGPGLPNALYNLSGDEVGTGTSYAPTPEPGSMLLLGSGLAAVYGAARRRRNQKSTSATQVG